MNVRCLTTFLIIMCFSIPILIFSFLVFQKVHLEALQAIFREMKERDKRTASVILTPPRRPSPRSESPIPSTSIPSVRSPSSVNTTLDELDVVNVSMYGDFDGDTTAAVTPSATPDHESSTSISDDVLTAAAAAAIASASSSAAAASAMWLSSPPQATSPPEDPILARFTALNSAPVATSSPPRPSPKTPKSTSEKRIRPRRAGARQSAYRYTDPNESWYESSESSWYTTSSEEEYDQKKAKK